ncbi:tuberin [Scaptodrosophila lebanonensis]|uniref:Tuberin n=1 Tax=Drosophila lebanonensis TaxID=7225 RepID=A0A6J2TAF9_DROLE|nr:tuberin [Scaptodrosophila lebanonensis]
MSSKDKEIITKSKMKMFVKKTAGGGHTGERTLRPEFERELRPEQPLAQRSKMLKDLCDLHLHNMNLEESSITKLWQLTNDLIVPNKPADTRQIALSFYKRLIFTQYKNLTLMREKFFLVIQNHEVREDLRHLLELLDTLTENGKDITNFEEKIGKFMLLWIPAIIDAELLCPYLDMLVNLIKFNAAHLDKEILVGIVQNACELSCTVTDDEIGLQCLTILEMVIGYTIFPSEPLPLCIVTLCRTVNHSRYCPASFKIMKNLLGTQLGYHSMKMMCNILNDRGLYEDAQLLRGAVFHLNMNIFGSNVIFQVSPMIYATNVLTGFLHALDSRQVIVTFEVILSVRMVINKYKFELSEIVWDLICDIMSTIVENIEYYKISGVNKDRLDDLQKNFHENIDWIEKLLQNERAQILGNDRIYDLIERVADQRPEASVLALIDYRTRSVRATRPEWLLVLTQFVSRYYRMSNINVRIKTISAVVEIMEQNRSTYEDEILDRVVNTQFAQIHHEPSVEVRAAVASALAGFAAHCDTKRCVDLLDILESLINRPFDQVRQHVATEGALAEVAIAGGMVIKSEGEINDIMAAVDGLIEVFAIKLHRLPATHAIKIFNILVDHLKMHYDRPKIFEQASVVRYKIFNWMLRARANASYHIGYPDGPNKGPKFSHYLGIDSPLQPQLHTTTISIRNACKLIVRCLEQDNDYHIFQLVIKELPKVLQNKALIQGNDIEELANTLLKINLSNNKFKRPTDEFHALVLPAIASLVIYHECLQPPQHNSIISVLNARVPTAIATVCISTMTILILEMPEALMRKLPDVLLQMSKMSDTNAVAIPVLEFLSLLIHLSNHLFTNFTPMQNMYVFAISLPYTKPHRYDHYTVSLAHHVIAGWFLKIKLELRKNCVGYIKSSMQSNAKMLYNDIVNINSLNEDSSNRKRSTSLTERGSRNSAAARNDSEMRPLLNNSLRYFHAELAETCFDFLARHTFSPCPSLPKRLPAVEHLLKDGVSQTWLVGHNLVTITTSGCPSVPTRNGLCERCAQLGKTPGISLNSKSMSDAAPPLSPEVSNVGGTGPLDRRYTKISLQHSSGNESAGSTELTSSSSSTSAATTHRQISNSSTASLEALSRRGSNPEAMGGGVGGGFGDVMNTTGSNTSLLGNSLSLSSASMSPSTQPAVQQPVCVRSCTGWGEVLIRRPTGNISWITRLQNPITNDCFGQDLPFNSMVSLFLPTAYGGVFGPESTLQATSSTERVDFQREAEAAPLQANATTVPTSTQVTDNTAGDNLVRHRIAAKARALQRQEEISSVGGNGGSMSTAAIDIPRVAATCKRGKEALCGSVSDGEADDDTMAFEDGQARARNPVRRVNSSPEMSSSWRQTFLAAKPAPLSQEPVKMASEEPQLQFMQQQQKKKSVQYSTKDMRVSCEAIPEEIAGSTPPQALEPEPNSLPPKQHSADDVNSQVVVGNVVQQSSSTYSLKLSTTAGKPPLSPAPGAVPPSPRLDIKQVPSAAPAAMGTNFTTRTHQGLAKSSSSGSTGSTVSGNNAGGAGAAANFDYNNGEMRVRSKTISVVREVNNGKARPSPASNFRSFGAAKPPINAKLCMNPSFVFLQLFSTGQLEVTETPLRVGSEHVSLLKLLDLVPPFETHRIGVLYVGQGQCNNEVEILRNSYGSTRYVEFLRSIGTLVNLKEAEQNNLFIGLDKSGADGKFTYIWKDDILQVTFHVATLMPTNLQDDPNCNEKKKHIGNDFVKILYNESGEECNLATMSGQFNYACVIVEPLELNSNRVYVKARSEISKYVCHPEPRIVSDRSAPLLARQMALHANLASLVYQSVQKKNPYASNWLERLRLLKLLRTKLIENLNSQPQSGSASSGIASSGADIDDQKGDFTKFT